VDNESYDDRTIITVDSANRPGTLVEVVQCLTELGLNVKRARISSDGGWFVDEFHVTETAGPMQQVSSDTVQLSSVLPLQLRTP
jgi:UTP:GlnB (protein PII) uridylyltransferase